MQEDIFKSVCEPCLLKLIEGHNACVIGYGQTGSGKTFSIFGEDERFSIRSATLFDQRKDRRGMIPRAFEYLQRKGVEFEEMREFEITVSVAEIYLDQVRDLGRSYNPNKTMSTTNIQQNYEVENLTIYENTNG